MPLAAALPPPLPKPVHYPDSDGEPMSDNTLQFRWIMVIKENLDALLPDFVAGNLLWYPIEGDNKTRIGPDVLVALGRPKGERGSYRQWEEGGQPPQVVFEVLSPGNTIAEMHKKLQFYDRHGVSEYYVIDPDRGSLAVQIRQNGRLDHVDPGEDYTSPLLGIRLVFEGEDLRLYRPDGQPFLSFGELMARAEQAEQRAGQAEQRAEQERTRAEEAERRAEQERTRAEALLARLRAAGLEP